MGVQIPHGKAEGASLRGKGHARPGHARRHSAMSCATVAEMIQMPFALWTQVGPRKHVLHRGVHWRHLENTIEPSMFSCPSKTAEPIKMPFVAHHTLPYLP